MCKMITVPTIVVRLVAINGLWIFMSESAVNGFQAWSITSGFRFELTVSILRLRFAELLEEGKSWKAIQEKLFLL